jgi:hypothetical protein
MTVNLESFRYPFETEIANESDGAKAAHRNAYQGILDLNQAVASLKSQLTSAITTTTSTTSTSTSTGTQTVVTNTATTTIGYINDQTGVTAYTTQQSDYAKFIILDDASPIAITLSVASSSPAITLPWYAVFLNFGAGTATLTPISGTISYRQNLGAASMPIAQNCAATVVYDGTNFWADLVPIATLTQFGLVMPDGVTVKISSGVISVPTATTSSLGLVEPDGTTIKITVGGVISVPTATYTTLGLIEAVAPISHEWINSINLSGIPQLSQPAFTDISGIAAPSQLPTPTTTTLGGVEAINAVSHNWINAINTSGVPQLSQPAFTDISGIAAPSQLPTPTTTTLGGVEAINPVSHEWINSINTSGVPQLSQPAFTDISGVASFSQIPLYPYAAKTANYTLTSTDYQIECTANSFTITLPTAVGRTGQIYSVKNSGTGTITLATTSSQTIDGQTTQTLVQWDNLQIMSNGASWIIL